MWRPKDRLAALAVLVGLACPTALGAAAGDDPAALRGAELAQGRCARCHAVALENASPEHDAPRFRVLSRLYSEGQLEMKLLDLAENGHFEMPRVTLSEDEAADLAAYISSLDGGAITSPPRARPTTVSRRSAGGWDGAP